MSRSTSSSTATATATARQLFRQLRGNVGPRAAIENFARLADLVSLHDRLRCFKLLCRVVLVDNYAPHLARSLTDIFLGRIAPVVPADDRAELNTAAVVLARCLAATLDDRCRRCAIRLADWALESMSDNDAKLILLIFWNLDPQPTSLADSPYAMREDDLFKSEKDAFLTVQMALQWIPRFEDRCSLGATSPDAVFEAALERAISAASRESNTEAGSFWMAKLNRRLQLQRRLERSQSYFTVDYLALMASRFKLRRVWTILQAKINEMEEQAPSEEGRKALRNAWCATIKATAGARNVSPHHLLPLLGLSVHPVSGQKPSVGAEANDGHVLASKRELRASSAETDGEEDRTSDLFGASNDAGEEADQVEDGLPLAPPAWLSDEPRFYHAVMQGLLLRRPTPRHDLVPVVFADMIKRGVAPNVFTVATLCASLLKLGQVRDALAELNRWIHGPIHNHRKELDDGDTGTETTKVKADQVLLSSVMKGLMFSAHHQAAYRVFIDSFATFNVHPNHFAYSNLLHSAVSAMKNASMGLTPSIRVFLARNKLPLARAGPYELEAEALWDGVPASLRARDLFLQELFAQYPELESIENPLDSMLSTSASRRASSDDAPFSSLPSMIAKVELGIKRFETRFQERFSSLFFTAAASPSGHAADREGVVRASTRLGASVSMERKDLAKLGPMLFDQYLTLLRFISVNAALPSSSASRTLAFGAEVPWDEPFRVLAWMRHLDLEPLDTTLYQACLVLHEGISPIWDAAMSQVNKRNNRLRYGQDEQDDGGGIGGQEAADDDDEGGDASAAGPLHAWLADWVGEQRVPKEREVGNYLRAQLIRRSMSFRPHSA
ncbi:hypothetical protein FA10DRAFT_269715 [Acaromyces ingoldii]|uniref:Uncharacterized protein n=1 Tax=Acaromyces ingoldii TaxID=215250 RepID=A0A316YH84_9BASI|nr:hypothetical protein FA10DRAFT_269715 [Acaromyces ingoldii]PWN87105.1 hypothetical protein FA10DRAFT_269715 [Acaromyces ingoldii]